MKKLFDFVTLIEAFIFLFSVFPFIATGSIILNSILSLFIFVYAIHKRFRVEVTTFTAAILLFLALSIILIITGHRPEADCAALFIYWGLCSAFGVCLRESGFFDDIQKSVAWGRNRLMG